jgi:hypothetical protein
MAEEADDAAEEAAEEALLATVLALLAAAEAAMEAFCAAEDAAVRRSDKSTSPRRAAAFEAAAETREVNEEKTLCGAPSAAAGVAPQLVSALMPLPNAEDLLLYRMAAALKQDRLVESEL